MKKITALVGGTAALLVLAAPAFAMGGSCFCLGALCRCRDINRVTVENYSESVANTGQNMQDDTAVVLKSNKSLAGVASVGGDRDITTGAATSHAVASVEVNSLPQSNCGRLCGLRRPVTNVIDVSNSSASYANTGYNSQSNTAMVDRSYRSAAGVVGTCGDRDIRSGTAYSSSNAWVVIDASVQ